MAVEAGGSRSHDFRPLFADVAGRIAAADLAFCHLETPLTDDLTALSGYPRFNGPAGLADDLVDVGYDACSTASNHALDKGWMGVLSTLAILEAAGIPQSGMAASESDASEPLLLDAGGITVGFVSATYGTNGMPRPEVAPWIVADLDLDLLLDSARRSREVGAEFVVVSLHWGIEYRTSPTATQREQAETLLADPDVDLVVGHHAHVVQPVGMVGEEFVVFGLGNFLTNQSASCCAVGAQDGVIVEVELQEVRGPDGDSTVIARGVSATPTRVDRADGHRIVDVPVAIAASVAADEAPDADLVASWYRTAERILAEELPEGLLRVQMGEG
ncbi:MAG: CapA family protein [Acidimicrobiales bacterium]|jgi:poly-gamma-glutamate capsule biosynthesis protein CapA/YwtB (metallophosphatase superfamily)|nr:CapA family protein [Acidimicrobiales bacterium]MDP6240038.1 CapA family protein [Acidimicrobiales bacterium]MDP7124498.1 CapA family protein [Acidimicrobiales bacterium]MDP7508620.1 CapA family protein [Acidimicrobiales bacterium]|tara:strand:- start:799 stop:1791 length:993 start_codon:yes stop_codon:yes gene_type:complete